ncbi:MAG: peptidase dimerization domain-containing protein, partial [Pseudomonadota bacterium]
MPWDEAAYLSQTGAPATLGEPGFTTRENLWARPTLEVNGLTSGWQGAGTKTVLPAVASAKITCRLVANQNPE